MNKRSNLILLLCILLLLLVLIACQSGADENAEATAVIDPTDPSPTTAATAEPEPTATPMPLPEPTDEPTDEPTAEPIEEPTAMPTAAAPGITHTYEIVPEESEARFMIDEVLLGNPKTVVGRTNQVSGEIVLDMQNPQAVEVGSIQVNARELTTDDSFRNRALRRQILDSAQDEYQFITFTPTEIEGLEDAAVELETAQTFSLTGELQIRDIVQMVTFEMMVTAVSETELHGFGEAVVLRSDYDLQIPSVPGVANVSDEVMLEIEFVAKATIDE